MKKIFSASESAAAKINLYLKILERRADAYHNLESVIVTVAICDQLSLSLFEANNKQWQVQVDRKHIPANEQNLAFTAAEKFFHWHKIDPKKYFLDIKIKKNIPDRAGLGGGSSNAAATIRLLEKAFFPDKKTPSLPPKYMAFEIGADVPYCYFGGTKYVRGIGEKVEKLAAFPQLPIILLKPPISISTQKAFAYIDKNNKLTQANSHYGFTRILKEFADSSCSYVTFLEYLNREESNSFLPVLQNYCPEINEYYSLLQNSNCLYSSLSGSGPTLFAIYDNVNDASHIFRTLESRFPEAELFFTRII